MNYDKIDKKARKILQENDRGLYTVPTKGLYPYQWNWDSAFAAWGFSTHDPRRAWAEIETLFTGQWDNGMVPHIVFHKQAIGYFPGPDIWNVERVPHTSGITQPPIAATMARAVYEADKHYGRVHMELMYGRLVSWHRWFVKYRLHEGMVVITHPWESGRDNAVDWDAALANVDGSNVGEYHRRDIDHVDPAMRPKKEDYDRFLALVQFNRDCGYDEDHIRDHGPFRVADVGMTFLFLRACRDLLHIAVELDHGVDEIEGWIKTLKQGVERHWNPERGHYDSVDVRTGAFTNSLSSASFLCWFAGIKDDRMLAHYDRIVGQVGFGIPSNDPKDPHFNHLRYWRGPVWGMVNALIGIGLAETGHTVHAERLRKQTQKLIAEHGFWEYFSPLDGAPAGGPQFTWTAAIWLTWASPHAKGRF
ncbi:MAG: hypothetical protein HWD91_08775 [Marivivens sp.]|uniref:MGH1-like glycoside hydrolase domain-containing protein n=1 Tax=Marivivens sp. TaxID=1978374 RepID=UPI0017B54905|nr:hypothetical protein [Marivivens sp.]NVJ95666.1 hypothetical protein [Marivivens sp.]